MNTIPVVDAFCNSLNRHAYFKAALYDGVNATISPEKAILLAAEELGEVSSEIIRKRYYAAVFECIDLAHTAMLVALSLDPTGEIVASYCPLGNAGVGRRLKQ